MRSKKGPPLTLLLFLVMMIAFIFLLTVLFVFTGEVDPEVTGDEGVVSSCCRPVINNNLCGLDDWEELLEGDFVEDLGEYRNLVECNGDLCSTVDNESERCRDHISGPGACPLCGL